MDCPHCRWLAAQVLAVQAECDRLRAVIERLTAPIPELEWDTDLLGPNPYAVLARVSAMGRTIAEQQGTIDQLRGDLRSGVLVAEFAGTVVLRFDDGTHYQYPKSAIRAVNGRVV